METTEQRPEQDDLPSQPRSKERRMRGPLGPINTSEQAPVRKLLSKKRMRTARLSSGRKEKSNCSIVAA
jgi:hypothetical protein